MKRLLILWALMALTYQTKAQHSTKYEKFLPVVQALWESLNSKNYKVIEPFIHEDFTFKKYGGAMGINIMKQVVAGYPLDLAEIKIVEVTEKGDTYELKTTFKITAGDEEHTLVLSKDLKLLKADVVDIQIGGHGESEKPSPRADYRFNDQRPEKVVLPLSIKERSMLVEAEIDGRKGMFYFDTGAPSVILNQDAFEPGDLEVMGPLEEELSGATGGIKDIDRIMISEFKMSGLAGKKIEALSTDLSHLSQPSLGLIGMDIMKGYLTRFDVKGAKIEMFKLDEAGSVKDESVLKGMIPIEVKMLGHLPLITVEIAGHKLNLLVDTGAGAAMFNPKYKELLKGSYEFVKKEKLVGAGKTEKHLEVFSLNEMLWGTKTFANVRVLFENAAGDSKHQHDGFEVDGLIGWDIFNQVVVTYHLGKNLIYIPKK